MAGASAERQLGFAALAIVVIAGRGEAQSAQQIQQVVSETIRQLDLSFCLPRIDSIASRLIQDWLGGRIVVGREH